MASKRARRRKACEGKIRFESHDAGSKACPRGCVTYKCDFGNHWHNGHPPKGVRQAIAARKRRLILA